MFEDNDVMGEEYTIKPSDLLSPDSNLVDDLSLQAGGVALFRLYNRKYCAISNAKIAFEIQHDDEIHFGRTLLQKRMLGAVLGDSILTLDNEDWRALRDSFNATFSKTNIVNYRDTNAAIIDQEIGIEDSLLRANTLEIDIKWFEKLFMKIFSLDMLGTLPSDCKCSKILKTFAEIQQLSIACL